MRCSNPAMDSRRAALRGHPDTASGLHCQLEFRPPLAWESLLTYLRLRSIPGVEWVDATHYRRTVAIDDAQGWIAVSMAPSGIALDVEMSPSLAPVIGAVIVRVKNLFDLGAAPDAVSSLLGAGPDARRRGAPLAGTARAGSVRRLRAGGARRARSAGLRQSRDHDGRALGADLRRSHCDALPGTRPSRAHRRSHARRRQPTTSAHSGWWAAAHAAWWRSRRRCRSAAWCSPMPRTSRSRSIA